MFIFSSFDPKFKKTKNKKDYGLSDSAAHNFNFQIKTEPKRSKSQVRKKRLLCLQIQLLYNRLESG